MHVLHPSLIWREATEELEQPGFWAEYDVSRIVSGATMLDIRNATLGLSQEPQRGPLPSEAPLNTERGRASSPQPAVDPPIPSSLSDADADADAAPISSSAESSKDSGDIPAPVPAPPVQVRISLADMVTTSIALRSGIDVEIVDAPGLWPTMLFPQSGTRSPSRAERGRDHSRSSEGALVSTLVPPPEREPPPDETLVPPHIAQAISGLQREVLLLKNDLNLELWTARENVKHIGRLYKERVLSRNEEVERQSLVSGPSLVRVLACR